MNESFFTELGIGDPGVISLGASEASLRSPRRGDGVYLMKIRTACRSRGQGEASRLLSLICETADRHELTLFLEVEEDDGLCDTDLADWYWRFGFRGDLTEMIREPRGVE